MRLSPAQRRKLFFLSILVGLAGGWWWHARPTEAGRDVRERNPFHRPVAASSERNPTSDGWSLDLPTLPPPGAIPGQALWRVRSADQRDHLARAEAAGLRVLKRLDALDLVLIGGDPGLLRKWCSEAELAGYNVPVSLPTLPTLETLGDGSSFRDGLLGFFHLEDRPDDWGSGIRIAILDTGIADHPALANAFVTNASPESVDRNGHGTAVASLIAGNDATVRGIAPGAELLVYPVLDENGQGDAAGIAEGILSAVAAGAQVISLSAGAAQESQVLREAVEYAAARDVVIVAAPGNDGQSRRVYPAAYDGVVAVGAIDATGAVAGFSNRGDYVDLVAPGTGLYSAYLNDQYVEFTGTSASVPAVSGLIAGLASEDLRLTPSQAVEELYRLADEVGESGRDASSGHGIVDPLRVQQRNDPNWTDLGIAAPALIAVDPSSGDRTIAIAVENRGNQYLAQAQVDITVNDITTSHTLRGIETNESVPLFVNLPAAALVDGNAVRLSVSSSLGFNQRDDRDDNDHYTRVIELQNADDPEP